MITANGEQWSWHSKVWKVELQMSPKFLSTEVSTV